MSTTHKNDNVEIIVSTYWPTKIIKSINLKRLDEKSSFNNNITLDRKDAEYLYRQLKDIFDPNDQLNTTQTVPPVIVKGKAAGNDK